MGTVSCEILSAAMATSPVVRAKAARAPQRATAAAAEVVDAVCASSLWALHVTDNEAVRPAGIAK